MRVLPYVFSGTHRLGVPLYCQVADSPASKKLVLKHTLPQTQQVDQLCRQKLKKPIIEVHRTWENVEDDGLLEDGGQCIGVSENLPGRVYTWQSCNFTIWADTLLPTMHKLALLP